MDNPDTKPMQQRRIHPLVATAAGAVIIASLAATAAVTGLFPKASSSGAQTDQTQAAQVATQPAVVDSAAPGQCRRATGCGATAAAQQQAQQEQAQRAPAACTACRRNSNNSTRSSTAGAAGTAIRAAAAVATGLLLDLRHGGRHFGGASGRSWHGDRRGRRRSGRRCGRQPVRQRQRPHRDDACSARSAAVWPATRSKSTSAARPSYSVRVRMESGKTRYFTYHEAPPFQQGQRVRVENGTLVAG